MLTIDQSYQPTGRLGVGWSGILGFLIEAKLAIPAADTSCSVAAGPQASDAIGATSGTVDASFWTDTFGVSEDFAAKAGMLPCSEDSAIYAILEPADQSVAVTRFQGYGGTIVRTKLRDGQQVKIEGTRNKMR
ncbi:DUF1269 domain-containing protein [Terriglobus sp. ADX1]